MTTLRQFEKYDESLDKFIEIKFEDIEVGEVFRIRENGEILKRTHTEPIPNEGEAGFKTYIITQYVAKSRFEPDRTGHMSIQADPVLEEEKRVESELRPM